MLRIPPFRPLLITTALFVLAPVLLASVGQAGPNAGGTLIVHYAGATVPPEPTFVDGNLFDCAGAVAQAPAGSQVILWFVYAAFPPNASPRLKVVSWGVDYPTSSVAVAWGVPPLGAVEITASGPNGPWPAAESGDLLGFAGTLTSTVDQIYTFAGYGESGASFSTVTHPDPVLGGIFASDGTPSLEDDIAAFGRLGFGVPGENTCPQLAASGACCRGVDGACDLVSEGMCSGVGDLYQGDGTICPPGGSCDGEVGACCMESSICVVQTYGACADQGWLYGGFGTTCSPNPCPQEPLGACCRGTGVYNCEITVQSDCTATWSFNLPCTPSFCTGGACCIYESGLCFICLEWQCEELGNLFLGTPYCLPNPCPQPGACCLPMGNCFIQPEEECVLGGGYFLGPGTDCIPNPCGQPPEGACCLEGDVCVVITGDGCAAVQGLYLGNGTDCQPNPCSEVPVESTTWGRIKTKYAGE